ncbi:MAG TPA: hypothetical protein VGA50_12895 [Kiloniellales bacterium]
MSLTSLLDENRDVRDFLRAAFKKPKVSQKPPLLVPAKTRNYGLVGTAFDYLVRLTTKRMNPTAYERGHWVAESAIPRLPSRLRKAARATTKSARQEASQFLASGTRTDALLSSLLCLAQLDTVFRTGRFAQLVGQPADPDDVADLEELAEQMPESGLAAKQMCVLNPTFGEASRAVGGADADLVLDETLYEIKTTVEPPVAQEHFHQLVGYYLLYRIGGLDGVRGQPSINRVGFYYSRQAQFFSWGIEDVVGSTPLLEAVTWFARRIGLDHVAAAV